MLRHHGSLQLGFTLNTVILNPKKIGQTEGQGASDWLNPNHVPYSETMEDAGLVTDSHQNH